MLRSARFLSGASASALSRLHETHCTGCAACTTRLRLTPEVNSGYLPAVGATDIFLFPSAATARLHKTRCTACGTCTTGIAFNGGSESRLLMPVGRAPDVARGPRALRDDLSVCRCELALGVPSKTSGNPSFDTSVRRRPDRSRPPQVGAGIWRLRRLLCPVCARHTVQDARLVRRRLRLTPEVNSGYLPAVGATV